MSQDFTGFTLEDVVMVPTKCEKCGEDSAAPTFKQYLEKKEHPIVQMLDKNGYVDILCKDCAEVAVDAYKKKKERD